MPSFIKNESLVEDDRVALVYKWKVNFPDGYDGKHIGVVIEFDRKAYKQLSGELKLIELPNQLEQEMLAALPPGCSLFDLESSIMKVASIK